MADNFNLKQFLMENKLGAYSKLRESDINEGRTAEELFQMFQDEDLVNDRREYDEEDLMSAYPDLSEKEAEKLVNMLQNIDETKEKEEEGYMGTQYDSSEDMAVDMVKKGITEKEEDYLVKGDNQVIVRIGDSVETLEDIFDQMMAMPTKNIRGLAEYGHQTIQDIKQMLKIKEGKDETLNEYEVTYREINGTCYRIDDEGNRDEVSMSYCMRYAEGKEEKEEAFGGINERLAPHVFSRMAGLSSYKAQMAMIKAAEVMMNELLDEGFEVDEIREYFNQLIANDI